MSAEENKAIVSRFFDECCNKRNLGVADEIFAPDHVYHDPSNPSIGPGPGGIRQLLSMYHSAFPDVHWNVNEMFASDDGARVVTRWTGTGTQTAVLPGIPATGKKATIPGIWIHRVVDGKIVESWNIWDTLGMLQQLGVVPQLGPVSV